MEKITATELATRLDEILQRVARGERFTITDRGHATAELGPSWEGYSAAAATKAVNTIMDIQRRVKPLGIPVRDAIEEGRL